MFKVESVHASATAEVLKNITDENHDLHQEFYLESFLTIEL